MNDGSSESFCVHQFIPFVSAVYFSRFLFSLTNVHERGARVARIEFFPLMDMLRYTGEGNAKTTVLTRKIAILIQKYYVIVYQKSFITQKHSKYNGCCELIFTNPINAMLKYSLQSKFCKESI